jgi:hypothetical protein
MKVIIPFLLLVPLVIGTSSSEQDYAIRGRVRALAVDEGSYYLPIVENEFELVAVLDADPGSPAPTAPGAKSTKTSVQTMPSAKSSKQCDAGDYTVLADNTCEQKKRAFDALECLYLYYPAIAGEGDVNCDRLLKCQALLFGDPSDPHPTDCDFETQFICATGAANMLQASKICALTVV